jgi:hypothetical protein
MAAAVATRDLHSEHFAHHFLADCSLIRGECDIALPRYRRALSSWHWNWATARKPLSRSRVSQCPWPA